MGIRTMLVWPVVASLVVVVFFIFGTIKSHLSRIEYSPCQTRCVSTANVPLMTHIEMRKVMHNTNDKVLDQSVDTLSVLNSRYTSFIRSRITEPDLSKPRRLSKAAKPGNFYSEARKQRFGPIYLIIYAANYSL